MLKIDLELEWELDLGSNQSTFQQVDYDYSQLLLAFRRKSGVSSRLKAHLFHEVVLSHCECPD
jgi:hypothetical protein